MAVIEMPARAELTIISITVAVIIRQGIRM
ncbi:MAG: hypothetical protein BWY73_00055 [candidate division TA06 bacterium ADurb.Bin417]|uniref:Uncharacterized protein n=1 Tax=candidate division TA06 bacterium ADurb.Bin417 TaxID=1852828 RepID=A0A1V5MKR4_UNCT6|nr:MAG: hypothetical protein BWY73_00055 [candidate division TA06 bacterium ADurb.Bin417]